MKYGLTLAVLLLANMILTGQTNNNNVMKTIEVTGTAERSIEPDKILFTISFEEYFKEEFEGKKYEDYKTKIDIKGIESSVIKELAALGHGMDVITLKQAGNGWRQRGKDFLVSKTIDVKLDSFAEANAITNSIKTRGVRNMAVTKLINENIDEIKLEVKTEALKAAKEKAVRLAAALDKKIKDIITIIEVDPYAQVVPRPRTYAKSMSMADESSGGANYENFKKIETKAIVRCVFEME